MNAPQTPPDDLPGGETLFDSLFDQAAAGMSVTSLDGRLLRVNDSLCRITGHSRTELLGRDVFDITHPDDLAANAEFRRQLLSGESRTRAYEKRLMHKDGSPVWVQILSTVVRDASGSPRCLVTLVSDITPLKTAQEALRTSETRFRRMADMSSDWYWMQDEHFRFLDVPGTLKNGLDPQVGKTRWDLPDLGPMPAKVWEQHRAVLERREPFSDFMFIRYTQRGEARYLSVSGEPLFDERGRFRGYHGVGKDITERAQAQKALEDSEQRYRMLFDIHPNPMWVVDSKTLSFLAVNDAAIRHYGYSRQEFLAITAEEIRPQEDVAALLAAFEDRSRAYMQRTLRHRKKNGELIDVEVVSFNLEFSGKPARLGVITDVTEKLITERRVLELEKQQKAPSRKG